MTDIEDRVAWFPQRGRKTRARQLRHLAQCGGQCVQEALEALDRGAGTLDAVLADFERLPPQLFHAVLYRFAALDDDELEP